ncbi:MAG: hypothetical protein Q9176_006608 [Flavoplaca citrina]
MDPISVAASVVGLLGAATKISEVLTHFIRGVKDAPRLAVSTLTEVEDLKICFRQLQQFIEAEEGRRRSHTAMVTVDQFVVVLTHAVMTFSELEAAVDGLKPRTSSMINGRFSSRLDEAREATESLTSVVNGVLDNTQGIRQRLEQSNLPIQVKHQSAPSDLENTMNPTEDDASTIRPARTTWASDTLTAFDNDPTFGFAFESDLRASRVYSRTARTLHRRSEPDQISLPSSTGLSMGSSFLSGISLAEVSNISLMSFPSPYEPLGNYPQRSIPRTMWLPPSYYEKTLTKLPQPRGISSAGKSTIIKQLQSMQGITSSLHEVEEARDLICTQLFEVFQRTCHRDEDLQTELQANLLSKYCDFSITSSSDAAKSNALKILQQFWDNPLIRWAVESASWPAVPNNISYMMDNIDKVLWHDKANNFDPSLCVHIMTNGLYYSTIEGEPFRYEIIDVGGTRAMRKKWSRCMQDLDSVIFVADLNGYCQTIEEEPGVNQMEESLEVLERITAHTSLQNTPILLLLNKADLFERTINRHPISDVYPEYVGGIDYWKACRFMADCYARRDRRPPGKLYCYVVDSLDTTAFQNAWRQVQEKITHTTLKY